MIINSKLSDEALLKAIYRAASEYSNLIGNSYLIIGKNKNSNYFYFQFFVLEKRTGEDKFRKVLMEVKKGLFERLFEELPEEIKSLIDCDVIRINSVEKS